MTSICKICEKDASISGKDKKGSTVFRLNGAPICRDCYSKVRSNNIEARRDRYSKEERL